ncbi:MAG: acetoin utilization protein AcuC [Dehalobacterium sp.]|jgi:acetoin utilization protein AcuC
MAPNPVKKEAVFLYSKDCLLYQFSPHHPFNPLRTKITLELLQSMNALDDRCLLTPKPAREEDLLLCHRKDYVAFVKTMEGLADNNTSTSLDEELIQNYGIGTEDMPLFKNMHRAGLMVVGATLDAIDQVMQGKARHALNLMGGLHHALAGKGSGFCIYNDIVIGIKHILNHYGKKVLYIDTDAHHGDGVQWAFYDEPRVCTLSLHETGKYLFPGTGAVHERGSGAGYAFTVNIPLEPFTEDASFIKCYQESFTKVMEYFKPDIIISQNGADAHYQDPLTHLMLTMKSYHLIPKMAHALAHKYCQGKWVALGGGGYNILQVVPRVWALIWLEMIHNEKKLDLIPQDWIEKWQKYSAHIIPDKWSDPANPYDPIPRKEEISYKNEMNLKNALYAISTELTHRLDPSF